MCKRWASTTKKACLYKHFMSGCPGNIGDGKLEHLWWTLVDSMGATEERLTTAGHVCGRSCRCSECQRLKEIEDKWICRVGSFYGSSGLNTRDEIKSRPEWIYWLKSVLKFNFVSFAFFHQSHYLSQSKCLFCLYLYYFTLFDLMISEIVTLNKPCLILCCLRLCLKKEIEIWNIA